MRPLATWDQEKGRKVRALLVERTLLRSPGEIRQALSGLSSPAPGTCRSVDGMRNMLPPMGALLSLPGEKLLSSSHE
ncbi:MAG TPA: hypothetical protein VFV38_33295 [Ktedonobacteraceae bacterium]|nr:hypothetical protein [Ktedonobacteraceae bacterium]